MFVVTVLVFLGAGLAANSEIHSLTCIYTALSKPDGTPGIHKFTSMGLLDGRAIKYYDSESERKVPKQEWMRECLSADHWGKGTEEQRLESLMNLMRKNDSVIHVLQGMRGCEGEMQPDGTLKFHRAMHTYAYDGNDLLSFDYKNEFWIAPITEAQLTVREWDSDQAMKEHIKRYLENECIDRLKMFLDYRKKQLENAPTPVVYVFAKKATVKTNLILTCLATGFYPKDIIMKIRRNRRVLAKEDGLMSSGGLPNGDDTFQRRDHVEILKSDLSTFICDVTHEATNIRATKLWNRSQLSDAVRSRALRPTATVLPVLVAVILAVPAVLLLLYKVVNPDRPQVQSAHVEVYAQNSKDGAKILLTCIARGQGVIDMEIKRNGETVKKGLMRSDTEPNIDGTLEIRAHVEISKDDKPEYSYEVIYEAPKNPTVNTFVCALPWSEPSELRPALKTVNPQSWHEINELLVCYTDTRRF
ncbi:unnamed protein product [Oreochromis niloticus]|nr:unnamed protein product [Mustela putorius furo]